MYRKICLLIMIIFIAFSFPIYAAKDPVEPEPVPIPIGINGTKTITFQKVIIRILSGTKVGAHHDGLLQVPQFYYIWQSNLSVGSEEFNLKASEIMKSYGYNITGGDNPLFEEKEQAKASLQLGCIITEMTYNTYGALAGNCSKVNLTMEWQLYDALQKKIIFKAQVSGFNKAKGTSSQALFGAFSISLKKLLANNDFVSLVTNDKNDALAEKGLAQFSPLTINLEKNPRSFSLPEDLPSVMESVATIRVGSAIASGVFISSDGYMLTAAHVVSGVNEVMVYLKSGISLPAQVIRADNPQDIALIKVPGSGYHAIQLAINEIPSIGSEVFAIGTPANENLSLSVSKGIVSGHRIIDNFSYIQTDASLSPGYSGGPLLNKNGQIIGIISWKIVAQGFEGLSFGIPPSVIGKRLNIVWN